MSIITEPIGLGGFEIVRDRIGAILYDELANQLAMRYDEWLDVERVYLGRYVNFNESELPAINVGVGRLDLDNHDVTQADGTGIYWIDCHMGAVSSENIDGGSLAVARMHDLVNVCMGILQHSEYKTLGFAPPFIMYRRVMQLLFNPPETKDSFSTVVGRIVMHVKAPETFGLYIPRDIESYKTVVKMHESERGYLYFGPPEAVEGNGFDFTLDTPFN
jgi:hypothetical protein